MNIIICDSHRRLLIPDTQFLSVSLEGLQISCRPFHRVYEDAPGGDSRHLGKHHPPTTDVASVRDPNARNWLEVRLVWSILIYQPTPRSGKSDYTVVGPSLLSNVPSPSASHFDFASYASLPLSRERFEIVELIEFHWVTEFAPFAGLFSGLAREVILERKGK